MRSSLGYLSAIALILAGCSGKAPPPPAPVSQDAALPAEFARASTFNAADAERFAKEITDNEFPIYISLMKASGLEAEIGGDLPTRSALHDLMGQWHRIAMGARTDMPRLFQVALGEESSYGLTGLGASAMVGITTGLMSQLVKENGTKTSTSQDGSMTVELSDKSVSTQIEFNGKVSNQLSGKLSTSVAFDRCPDVDGKIHLGFHSKSALSKAGSKAGANLDIQVEADVYYNDDAKIIPEWDITTKIAHAAFNGTGKGVYIEGTWTTSRDGKTNSASLDRVSSQATEDDAKVVMAQKQMAELMTLMMGYLAQDAIEQGGCVVLKATATPSKRNRVAPSTPFSILAEPRSKMDGQPTSGTVVGTLEGEGKLDPAGTKVNADATFSYIAPAEKQKKGLVKLVARSKRGVGKADLDFDTMTNAFMASGGADEYHGTGRICDLTAPFEISGSGVVNKFVPTSASGGTYTYTGTMSGFKVWGNGTYTVTLAEDGEHGQLTATGPGSVATPFGTQTANGTEIYTLDHAEGCN